MKRFVLFCGDNYYPSGGWDDYAGDFDSVGEAQEALAKKRCDWWHIVDTGVKAIVAAGHR